MKETTTLIALFFSLITHVTISQTNLNNLITSQKIGLSEVESYLEEHKIVPLQCIRNSHNDVKLEAYNARDSSFRANENIVINIYFHILEEKYKTEYKINEEHILDAVALLNETFNQHRIYFKLKGFDYLFNKDFLKVYLGGTNTFQHLITHSKEKSVFDTNSLNVFVVKDIALHPRDEKSLSGAATRVGITTIMDDDYLLTSSLVHEIGHNFSLQHTHHNWDSAICETVIRNDGVDDTLASVPFDKDEVASDCSTYIGKNKNNKCGAGVTKVPANNFMSSNTLPCRSLENAYFSEGQVQRMRNMLGSSAVLRNTLNTIESLYYPYKGNYEVDYLGASVMNKSNNVSFQKGFDYEFVPCVNTQLNRERFYSKYETPDGHPFYTAVKIIQISTSKTVNCNIPNQSEYTKGVIARFGRSFSGEFERKELNSNDINNDGVINHLSNGLNIIKLENSKGKITRKKVYKDLDI
ncbi:M43 family zinc metalloprotease [uncultured Tenacibaculum sp.]|uniref:M43 family zinc metalloprotease n=1 Tax=uncultured Tenacibaculum sp. TaxID=174713 RepID=UPI00262B034B|nr:M43 family zinc metalloprotease [uncultured Tenacibaculum sp.]